MTSPEEVTNPILASRISPSSPVGGSSSGKHPEENPESFTVVIPSPMRSPLKRRNTPGTARSRSTPSTFDFNLACDRQLDSPRLLGIGIHVAPTPRTLAPGTHYQGLLSPAAEEKKLQRIATFKAMGLIGFSAFVYSLQTLNVKVLGGEVDPLSITLFRGVVGSALSVLSSLLDRRRQGGSKPVSMWGHADRRHMLYLRGLLGGVTIATAFFAVASLDLAVASTIIFTAPLWTAVLACVLDKGAWTRVDSLSALCCVVGMLLITRPPALFPSAQPSKPVNALGVLAGLVSAVSAAGVNLTIRRLKSETAATITLYAMLGSVLVVLPGLLWKQVAHGAGGLGLQQASVRLVLQLCLTGLLSWLAQMTKTSGLKMSKSLGVLVMRYLDIAFAFLWDITLLHAEVDAPGVGGALTIVLGCLISILSKGQG